MPGWAAYGMASPNRRPSGWLPAEVVHVVTAPVVLMGIWNRTLVLRPGRQGSCQRCRSVRTRSMGIAMAVPPLDVTDVAWKREL